MDNITQLAEKHAGKLKYLFLIGASIGLINTFCRADYNFILYLYIFYIWLHLNEDKEIQTREKVTLFYILVYSLFIDIIWCFFWQSQWGYLKEDIESGTHSLVIFLSWIGILLKIAIGIIIAVSEKIILKGTLPKKLAENLNHEYLQQIDENNQ